MSIRHREQSSSRAIVIASNRHCEQPSLRATVIASNRHCERSEAIHGPAAARSPIHSPLVRRRLAGHATSPCTAHSGGRVVPTPDHRLSLGCFALLAVTVRRRSDRTRWRTSSPIVWTAAPSVVGALQGDWIARATDRLAAADSGALAPDRIARIVAPIPTSRV
jgi:hypothetical protein